MGRDGEPTEGILYTAIGDEFVEEAANSANRLQDLGVEYPTAIITDQEVAPECFDHVIQIDRTANDRQDWLFTRLDNLSRTPFDRTIYLDTDTWVVAENAVSELFELLDRFDVIATREFGRRLDLYRPEPPDILPSVEAPPAFPMFHAGIFGFRDSTETAEFLQTWRRSFERHVEEWPALNNDQPAFRVAIYKTDVNVGRFAPEYNFRLQFPQQVVGEVKIIHGRAANYEDLTAQLNKKTRRRICYPVHTSAGPPDGRPVDVLTNPGMAERIAYRFKRSVSDYGLVKTTGYTLAGGPVRGRKRVATLKEKMGLT